MSNLFGAAYCLNQTTQKWYNFDDSRVSLAEEREVVSPAAYVLYYVRSPSGDKSAGPKV